MQTNVLSFEVGKISIIKATLYNFGQIFISPIDRGSFDMTFKNYRMNSNWQK